MGGGFLTDIDSNSGRFSMTLLKSKKLQIPLIVLVSAALGAGAVVAYNHVAHKPQGEQGRTENPPQKNDSAEEHFNSILKDQEQLFRNFDSMFDDDFFRQRDPFEEMKKFRERLGKHFKQKDEGF